MSGGAVQGAGGDRTSGSGTPVPVDVSQDRRTRIRWVVLVAGPVVAMAHFAVVYLVAEAGCNGGGPGLRAFGPPVPDIVTVCATAVAASACLANAWWARRRWQLSRAGRLRDDGPGTPDDDTDEALSLAGLLLSGLGLVTVLFVGVPTPLLLC